MRQLVFAAGVLLSALIVLPILYSAAARAGEPDDSIRAVIAAQIDAFRADDAGRAFSFAAPIIRGKFGTPDNFMDMVRIGYPEVYRPRSVEFRDLKQFDGRPAQDVWFLGESGHAVIGRYFMEQQPDGSWKIAGVAIRPAPELGA